MFDLDDWIRLGLLVLVSFASCSDARIDYSNGGKNKRILKKKKKFKQVDPINIF